MPSATAARPSPDIPIVTPPARVALLGAGAFGRFCLEAYQKSPDIQVLWLSDPSRAALDTINAPGVRKEAGWETLAADERVEVVHLATPPHVRAEVAFAALEAGKSVFCEKPLALTLSEADAMIEAAARHDVALGVDYVMRHQPAFHLLEALAASGCFGQVRSLSVQNFAQAVPPGHWFWDRSQSGGILVEHGVHFFDAYGRVAGIPTCVWGSLPRREAIEVTVRYNRGAVGRYYHEFAFPREVERTTGTVFFERGYVEIDGWIPTRVHGEVLACTEAVQEVADQLRLPLTVVQDRATRFEILFGNREESYQAAIVSGMRDAIQRHRDRGYRMEVPPEDARASLALALAAQQAAEQGIEVDVIA